MGFLSFDPIMRYSASTIQINEPAYNFANEPSEAWKQLSDLLKKPKKRGRGTGKKFLVKDVKTDPQKPLKTKTEDSSNSSGTEAEIEKPTEDPNVAHGGGETSKQTLRLPGDAIASVTTDTLRKKVDVFPPHTLPLDAPLYYPHEEEEPFRNTERFQTPPHGERSAPVNAGAASENPASIHKTQTNDIDFSPVKSVSPVKKESSPTKKPSTPPKDQSKCTEGNASAPAKESPGAYIARFVSFDFSFSPAKVTEEVTFDPPAPTKAHVSPSQRPTDSKSEHIEGQNPRTNRTLTRCLTGDFSQIPVGKLFAEPQETQMGSIRHQFLFLIVPMKPKTALEIST